MTITVYVMTSCNQDDVECSLDNYSLHSSLQEAQQEVQDICMEDTPLDWVREGQEVWNASYGNLQFRIRLCTL